MEAIKINKTQHNKRTRDHNCLCLSYRTQSRIQASVRTQYVWIILARLFSSKRTKIWKKKSIKTISNIYFFNIYLLGLALWRLIWALIRIPAAPAPIQLPAKGLGKAAKHGLSAWALPPMQENSMQFQDPSLVLTSRGCYGHRGRDSCKWSITLSLLLSQ